MFAFTGIVRRASEYGGHSASAGDRFDGIVGCWDLDVGSLRKPGNPGQKTADLGRQPVRYTVCYRPGPAVASISTGNVHATPTDNQSRCMPGHTESNHQEADDHCSNCNPASLKAKYVMRRSPALLMALNAGKKALLPATISSVHVQRSRETLNPNV